MLFHKEIGSGQKIACRDLAKQRLDQEGIQRLQAALDAHLSAAREVYLNGRFITDMEFHLTLASLSGRNLHQ